MENFISCAVLVDLTSFSISENKKEESGACGMAMYSKYQKPKITNSNQKYNKTKYQQR